MKKKFRKQATISGGFLDPRPNNHAATDMKKSVNRGDNLKPINGGEHLRGMKKALRGYAYLPRTTTKKGVELKTFSDGRSYAVMPDGSYRRTNIQERRK